MLDPIHTKPADYDETLMGPGFFVFFQYGTIETGGYERQEIPEPWKYKPKVRFEYKEEEKPAIEIIEAIAEKALEEKPSDIDLELALRLKLEQEQLQFRLIYLIWIKQIIFEDETAEILLLLH